MSINSTILISFIIKFVLLFEFTAASATTTLATTTATSLCQGATELSYPVSDTAGNYLKTACFVFSLFNQADADAYCKAEGMKLFQIDSLAVQTSLFAFLEPQLEGYDVMFRVDGIRDPSDDSWYYYNNGKAPAFNGLDWLQGPDVLAGFDTMMITNMQYPQSKLIQTFKVDGIPASLAINVLCEYQ